MSNAKPELNKNLHDLGSSEVLLEQSSPTHHEITHYIDNLEKKIKKFKNNIKIIEETIEKLRTFSFKEGDIVISKSCGNGIVCGIGLGEPTTYDEEFKDKFYVVLASKNGYIQVSPDDIIPYTAASKILYERN